MAADMVGMHEEAEDAALAVGLQPQGTSHARSVDTGTTLYKVATSIRLVGLLKNARGTGLGLRP
jgi:hypothetical protein